MFLVSICTLSTRTLTSLNHRTSDVIKITPLTTFTNILNLFLMFKPVTKHYVVCFLYCGTLYTYLHQLTPIRDILVRRIPLCLVDMPHLCQVQPIQPLPCPVDQWVCHVGQELSSATPQYHLGTTNKCLLKKHFQHKPFHSLMYFQCYINQIQ